MNKFFESAGKAGQLSAKAESNQKAFQELMAKFEEKKWDEVIADSEKLKNAPGKPETKKLVSLIQISALVETKQRANQLRAKQLYLEVSKIPIPADVHPDFLQYLNGIEETIKMFIEQLDINEKKHIEHLEEVFKEHKDDPQALFEVAISAIEQGAHGFALRCLYAVIQKDMSWGEKKAHKLYIEILKDPNADKSAVLEYRKKLATLIA